MAKYTVHYGVRFTTNFIVEADSEEEAREKAKTIGEDIDVSELKFASDDIDVWKAKSEEINAYSERNDI